MPRARPADATFPAGTQEVAEVTFTAAVVTNTTPTTITFVDQPVVRQGSDAGGHVLTAIYTPRAVSIAGGAYEADVSPRPRGGQAGTVIDLVQIRRVFAALGNPAE